MTVIRNIKVWLSVACLVTSMAAPAPEITMDIIDMAAISRMTPQQLEALAEGLAMAEIMRTKRSSAQALTSAVVSKASSGLQSKLGFLGQASAGASSFIASASSKSGHGGGEEGGYSYESGPHDGKVDYWGLKKSILYTLFQAVKAITGGVTILKGQLIKGGGALAATLGKVISGKGDAVSNLGKKIVSSAALSPKKTHSPPVVYGPPPPVHIDYPSSAYGAPTAPAAQFHTGLSAPTGFAAHKYPAHLDGRGKLNGLHAGLVILTPLEHDSPGPAEYQSTAPAGHTPLEPPSSILHTAFSAIKNVFSSAIPSTAADQSPASYHSPPPSAAQSFQPPPPPFKPMNWGAVNSYGEPAMFDTFSDYDPRNHEKKSSNPTIQSHGLTSKKLEKINHNLEKLNAALMNSHQRSSEDFPIFGGMEFHREMLMEGPLSPTPVVSDNEIGVLPAELLPSDPTSDPVGTTSSTTTTTTTVPPKTESNQNRRKDVKYILRGNRIVQV